jgi:hypothetical protein
MTPLAHSSAASSFTHAHQPLIEFPARHTHTHNSATVHATQPRGPSPAVNQTLTSGHVSPLRLPHGGPPGSAPADRALHNPLLLLQLLHEVGLVHEDVLVAVGVGAGEDLGADAGDGAGLARNLVGVGRGGGVGWGGAEGLKLCFVMRKRRPRMWLQRSQESPQARSCDARSTPVTVPPAARICSAVLYTSVVESATWGVDWIVWFVCC